MSPAVIRTAVQAVVAALLSLLVARAPGIAGLVTPEIQAGIVGAVVVAVVAVQRAVEKKFPALGIVTRAPSYQKKAAVVVPTHPEFIADPEDEVDGVLGEPEAAEPPADEEKDTISIVGKDGEIVKYQRV